MKAFDNDGKKIQTVLPSLTLQHYLPSAVDSRFNSSCFFTAFGLEDHQ